ncbi:MAG: DUF6484 domain-containing protein [Acidobacteriota bacterium]
MNGTKAIDDPEVVVDEEVSAAELLRPLLGDVTTPRISASADIVIGELVGIRDGGQTPLVVLPGQQGRAALEARSTIDVHAAHIGRKVVVILDGSDLGRPIILGVLRSPGPSLADPAGQVTVDSDGERMIVSAKRQLVLRCGKASITLTSAGKVMIEGTFVSSRSSGVNRVKGGSVQVN